MVNAVDPQLADRLHSVAIHLLRRVRTADRECGVSPARLSLLSVLVFGGPCTLGELADAEQVAPATISNLIAGLERDGHVQRRRDDADRRVHRVRATAKGRRVLDRARRARVAEMEDVLRSVSRSDRVVVDQAVRILSGHLV